MSTKDTEDVLDFINSLPDSKSGTPAPRTKKAESNDDFMDFLDELSAHEKASKAAGTSKGKFEPRKKEDKPAKAAEPARAAAVAPAAPVAEETVETEAPKEEEGVIDPIASISSWWTTEGSSKVLSLWGLLTSNAHQLSEQTYQLASNTSQQLSHQRQKFLAENSGVAEPEQILHITSRLNLILTTMSQQIKDGLIDKEDELLNILLVYDLNNVDYLDSLCAQKFNKVMGQVEGGIKVTVNNFNHKHELRGGHYCDLGMFHGKAIDGEKLCFANLDSSIKDYVKITELEQQSEHKGEDEEKSEAQSEPQDQINTSNVFIAIQPISTGTNEARDVDASAPVLIEANNADSFAFTMILKDITNNITLVSKSQPFPLRWAKWVAGEHADVNAIFGEAGEGEESVDPSEWVRDWLRDGLGLSFAVLAQEYVTKRMGIK